jgi:hypothetical protein
MENFQLPGHAMLSACKQHGVWFPRGLLADFIETAIDPRNVSVRPEGSLLSDAVDLVAWWAVTS